MVKVLLESIAKKKKGDKCLMFAAPKTLPLLLYQLRASEPVSSPGPSASLLWASLPSAMLNPALGHQLLCGKLLLGLLPHLSTAESGSGQATPPAPGLPLIFSMCVHHTSEGLDLAKEPSG